MLLNMAKIFESYMTIYQAEVSREQEYYTFFVKRTFPQDNFLNRKIYASTVMWPSVFRDITWRKLVVGYRRFGNPIVSIFRGEDAQEYFPEATVPSYRNILEDLRLNFINYLFKICAAGS